MKRPTLLFICLFAISTALHAVTFKEDTKICGVCGQPVHVTIAQNLLTGGGSMDLDLRPAPEKRDTLKYQIQLCRKCGYCWPDIAKERKHEKIAKVLNAKLAFDDTAALFARAAEIEIADNAPSFASYMLYMKAAWVMDDLKNKKKSDEYRKLAIKQMELYMERDAIARTTGDNYLALIDVLRRIGEFEKAKRILSIAELYATESVLPQILAFQKKLIENKDSERYTTADALKAVK
ncbi:MAG: DUF2225 domain-containing protein [Lentisphaeria bacterium]|nr:DUF2225 domain-containing protein [Lentisphaeria bacterium]